MIDEDMTMQLYGYYSTELMPGSHKRVVVVCEECGRYNTSENRNVKELCHSCGTKGENSPNWRGGKITLTCKQCGKEFNVNPAKKDTAKFCSRKCSNEWRSENLIGENSSRWAGGKISSNCLQCGKNFYVKRSEKNRKFCSRICMGEWRSENLVGENHPLYGEHFPERMGENHPNWKPKIALICIQCGTTFDVIPSGKDRKFCSAICSSKWQSENLIGENSPNWECGEISVVCRQCKKEFNVIPAREDTASFCSVKCKGEWMSENLARENSPNWNQNIGDEERIVGRIYPEYYQWRNDVYKRDNHTCQICGDSTGGNLNAHHIESYNNNPELRTELSNGITICEDCHKNFHHIYGFGNNTRDQYNEFLMTMYNNKEL